MENILSVSGLMVMVRLVAKADVNIELRLPPQYVNYEAGPIVTSRRNQGRTFQQVRRSLD